MPILSLNIVFKQVWSLRSRGDGSDTLTSQWTYNLHKKSINSLTFLDGLRLAASCDSRWLNTKQSITFPISKSFKVYQQLYCKD
jgi:hypothetical protein